MRKFICVFCVVFLNLACLKLLADDCNIVSNELFTTCKINHENNQNNIKNEKIFQNKNIFQNITQNQSVKTQEKYLQKPQKNHQKSNAKKSHKLSNAPSKDKNAISSF